MNLLASEIKDYLAAQTYIVPTTVVERFDASVKAFPRIVVVQTNDMTVSRDATKELVSQLSFQLEVYTKDTVDGEGNVMSRLKVNDAICNQVDAFMYQKYKMNRDGITDDKAYATDTSRRIIRYSCAIDQFGYTYRTI